MALRELIVNEGHYIFHFYFGLVAFHELYMGGEIPEFVQTINHFDVFLESRPRNVIVLTCLGRTYYFFAKYYDFLDMAEKGTFTLDRALDAAGERPPFLIHNTQGALCLLLGLNEKALEHNRTAYELGIEFKDDHTSNFHNIYAGIGKCYARMGRLEEARANYEMGLALVGTDVNLCVAMAETYLKQRDAAEALRFVNKTILVGGLRFSVKSEYCLASAFLVSCRAHLMAGEFDEAIADLNLIYDMAIYSQRDFVLAAFVIAIFSEELVGEREGDRKRLNFLALKLCGEVLRKGLGSDRKSPLHHSLAGLNSYFRGEYEGAIVRFEEAIDERKIWPRSGRSFRWDDDARDRFFLAICHAKLVDDSDAGRDHAMRRDAFFEEAERACREKEAPIETADIIERVRRRAKEVLGKE